MSWIVSRVNPGLNVIKVLSLMYFLGELQQQPYKEALFLSFLPDHVENCWPLITY